MSYVRGLRPSSPASLGDFLDGELLKIQRAIAGISTGTSGGLVGDTITANAGVALGGQRAVYFGSDSLVYYADSSSSSSLLLCGVTQGSATLGSPVVVQTEGIMEEPSWSWTTGGIVYLSTTGLLTQTAPTSGYLVQVGIPLGPTRLLIEPQLIAKL